MNNKEKQILIDKALKALEYFDLKVNYTKISITKYDKYSKEFLEFAPELLEYYSIIFHVPDFKNQKYCPTIRVNRKTDKLHLIITRSNMSEIPEDLK